MPPARNADDDARARAFRLKGGYAVSIIAMAIFFWLLAQSDQNSWITPIALLAIDWLFYALERWYQARS